MITKEEYFENLVDLLFATLLSGKNKHTFYSILSKRELKRHKEKSIRSTLSRMKEKGYAEQSPTGWSLTPKGKIHFQGKTNFSYIASPFKDNAEDEIILSFDIPENKRKTRNWVRNQIKIFGYRMIQQSLWVGPGPLPKEFFRKLESMEIKENIKTFKIKTRKI